MKVLITTLNEAAVSDADGRDYIHIEIDGRRVFSVHDGEPEDNNLGRNFCDCYTIDELLRAAHKAGKNGEKFELVSKEDHD